MTGWFLVAGAAFLALLYGVHYCGRDPSAAKSLVKTGSMAGLALAALFLGAPALVTAGLALGAVGDFFLSRRGDRAFLAGMAAFAAGHLAYATAFWTPGSDLPLLPVTLLLLLSGSTELWLAPHTGPLRWPVRGYVAVIAAMALASLTLPLGHIAQIGAALFVLSDLLLALEMFVLADGRIRRALSHLLWAAYWSGQALIFLGMLPAAAG